MKNLLIVALLIVSQLTTNCKAQQASMQVVTKNNNDISLYQAYEGYFPIGAAISPKLDLVSEERQEWIATQYNSITAENQMKTKYLQPKEGEWRWAPADEIVAYAIAHDMKIRGHALVWYQATPKWMLLEKGQTVSAELLRKRIVNHIETVVGKYKKYVYCWDVVNEVISNNPKETYKPIDTLYEIIGEDYVALAFETAHRVDPEAQLFYNDYRFSDPIKRQKIYNLLKKHLNDGVPIHGVGLQSHLVPDEISEAYLQETIDMFSSLGLKIQITELDISVYNYRTPKHPDKEITDDAYTPERLKKQAEMYEMVMRVCRKNKDVVTGVTLWGTSDSRNNYRTQKLKKMDYPFLYDESMNAKPFLEQLVSF